MAAVDSFVAEIDPLFPVFEVAVAEVQLFHVSFAHLHINGKLNSQAQKYSFENVENLILIKPYTVWLKNPLILIPLKVKI